MRITKDIAHLKMKLQSAKDEYLSQQRRINVGNSFGSLSTEGKATLRYLQGKIDSIDDTLYLLAH